MRSLAPIVIAGVIGATAYAVARKRPSDASKKTFTVYQVRAGETWEITVQIVGAVNPDEVRGAWVEATRFSGHEVLSSSYRGDRITAVIRYAYDAAISTERVSVAGESIQVVSAKKLGGTA